MADDLLKLAERFWPKVSVGASNECWPWIAYVGRNGYGDFGVGGRKVERSHRVAYKLVKGPIPEGLQIDHLCRNRRCCNPEHLEAVSPAENTRRGYAGLHKRIEQLAKTHCPQGHEYTPENTYVWNGKRNCKICVMARQRRRRAAARACG